MKDQTPTNSSSGYDLEKFFALSLDMLAIAGHDGYYKLLNPRWERVLGWTTAELCSRPFVEFVHPDDVSATINETKSLKNGIDTIHFTNRYKCKDGSYKWLLWTSTNHLNFFYAVARDITELKNREHLLESIIDHLPVALFCKDAINNFNFILWNKMATKIWGLKKQEVVGKTDFDFFPKEQAEGFRTMDAELMKGEDTAYIPEEEVTSPTIGTRIVRTIKVPVFNETKDPQFLLGISEDITERVQLEKRLEIERLKVLQTSKMSSLGEMAGGVAHEINNPLSVVQGSAQLLINYLERGNTDPKRLIDIAQKIVRTSNRISRIIKGLRHFSRDGSQDAFVSASVTQIIRDSLELCAEKMRNSGVELRFSEPKKDVCVDCRAVQISQVLINLINNSFDAIRDAKEKWIEIEVVNEKKNVVIAVIDSGGGVPSDLVQSIFQPFFTTKPSGEGTGLGLSICQSILESHRGEMYLDESSPHTRFVMSLPKKQE